MCSKHYQQRRTHERKYNGTGHAPTWVPDTAKRGRPRIEYSPESVRAAINGTKGGWAPAREWGNSKAYDYHPLRWRDNSPLPERPKKDAQRRSELRNTPAGMTSPKPGGALDTTNSTLGGLHPTFVRHKT